MALRQRKLGGRLGSRRTLQMNFILVGLAAVVGGCDYIEKKLSDPQPSISGGGWLTTYDSRKDQVDLITALDPDGLAKSSYTPRVGWPNANDARPGTKVQWGELTNGQKIDLAFKAFYDSSYDSTAPEVRRNRLQEQLLAVSGTRCALFKSLVYELRSKTNFGLGSLATAAGVAGGIVTGAGLSRALSGAAGIFSGVRAEFNQELFQNLATQVIIEGIDVRRREIYDQIVNKGQALTIRDYPVEAAVKDAIYYHAQCNVVTGFQMAQDSIKTYADPGIDAANRMLVKLGATRELLQNRNLTPQEAATLLTSSTSILGLAGKPAAGRKDVELPINALFDARVSVKLSQAAFSDSADKILSSILPDAEKAKLRKAADDARVMAEKQLDACQPTAVERSTAMLAARSNAASPVDNSDAAIKNRSLYDKARNEAATITQEINALVEMFSGHIAAARAILREAENDETKVAGAADRAIVEIGKTVASGVCDTSKKDS